jgi:hypothetical protein
MDIAGDNVLSSVPSHKDIKGMMSASLLVSSCTSTNSYHIQTIVPSVPLRKISFLGPESRQICGQYNFQSK